MPEKTNDKTIFAAGSNQHKKTLEQQYSSAF
jgi:hypothetical protein